mmetsp:Transcript_70552/g.117884  ORF Transcript_70552/g.117884 Transcript_70552/m.117884 type:complete len:334 (-) Transcript_70552:256-1257(-)
MTNGKRTPGLRLGSHTGSNNLIMRPASVWRRQPIAAQARSNSFTSASAWHDPASVVQNFTSVSTNLRPNPVLQRYFPTLPEFPPLSDLRDSAWATSTTTIHQILSSRTTAWQDRARPSPMESTFSWVRALIFTRAGIVCRVRTMLAFMASLMGATRGFCSTSVMSTFMMRYPRFSMSRRASSTKASEAAPLQRGSLSGNNCPISGSPNAPKIPSVRLWYNTSPSEWATTPRSQLGTVTPPMTQPCPASSTDDRRWMSQPWPMRIAGSVFNSSPVAATVSVSDVGKYASPPRSPTSPSRSPAICVWGWGAVPLGQTTELVVGRACNGFTVVTVQ